MNKFIEKFITEFKSLCENDRDSSRTYNHLISKNKYIMVHPIYDEPDDVKFLIFATDDNSKVCPVDLGQTPHDILDYVFNSTKYHNVLRFDDSSKLNIDSITETLYIKTSLFSRIELTVARWHDLINAPKLRDGHFSDLCAPFEKYFNIEDDYECCINFHNVFSDENKPKELELCEIFHDVCSDGKYGTIQTSIFWNGEFIGWYTRSGRWLDTYIFNTVNPEKWKVLMNAMLKISGYEKGERIPGVDAIYEMDINDDVEDITNVPGFTEPTYGDE